MGVVGRKTEVLRGARSIGHGLDHVSRLHRLVDLFRRTACGLLDDADEALEFDRRVVARCRRDAGRLRPRLRRPAGGAASIAPSTPATMSSIWVKSRRIRPWLNTWIGRPASTARENSSGAMSGRPHGP
jgi:hypothetical protein